MKKTLLNPVSWCILYLLMAINTFGHSWVKIINTPGANEAAVLFGSLFSALLWPLYWSVKFWS